MAGTSHGSHHSGARFLAADADDDSHAPELLDACAERTPPAKPRGQEGGASTTEQKTFICFGHNSNSCPFSTCVYGK